MNKDFNVYKWRREHLVENETSVTPDELFKAFNDDKELGNKRSYHRDDQNRIKILSRFAPDEKKAIAFFKSKGYNVEITDTWDMIDPSEEKPQIWYDYTKI